MPSIKILVLLTTLQIAAATKEPILPISNSAVVSYPHGFSTSSPDSSEDLLLDGSSILPSPLGHSKMHKRSGAAIEDTERIRKVKPEHPEFFKDMLGKMPAEGPSLSRQGSSASSHYSDAMSTLSDTAGDAVDASVKPLTDSNAFVPTPGYKIVRSRDPNDPIVEWKIPEEKKGRLPRTFETRVDDLSGPAADADAEIFKTAPGQPFSRPPANSLDDVVAKGKILDAFIKSRKAGNRAAPAPRAPAAAAKPPAPKPRKMTPYEIQKYAAQKFGLPEPPKPDTQGRDAAPVRQAARLPSKKPADYSLVVSLKKLLGEGEDNAEAAAAAAESAQIDPAGPSTLTAPKPDKQIPGMMSKKGSHSFLIKVPSFEVSAKEAARMGHTLSEEARGIAQASAVEAAQEMARAISKLHL